MRVKECENVAWTKKYRLFLCLLLVSILLFAGGLYYYLMEETKDIEDGIFVQKVVPYENA